MLALLALALHRFLRAKGPASQPELARGLTFLASAYLAGFFFLACVSGIARFLHLVGLARETSALLAVPLGLVVAYKIYAAYEKWRLHE